MLLSTIKGNEKHYFVIFCYFLDVSDHSDQRAITSASKDDTSSVSELNWLQKMWTNPVLILETWEQVARKWPEIKKSWLLHHDNARPQTLHFTQALFTKIENLSDPTSTLQSEHSPLRFLVVPHCQKRLTLPEIWQWYWCQKCSDKCSKTYSLEEFQKKMKVKW